MADPKIVKQDSGRTEYYTPAEIVAAARSTMGSIDLDPASCAEANETVGAFTYYTKEDDGLSQQWFGNVWLNWPYGRGSNKAWSNKLVEEFLELRVVQACCIVNASTDTEWFQTLLSMSMGVCFISGRVKFIQPGGQPASSPLYPSAVMYFGDRVHQMRVKFADLGTVL